MRIAYILADPGIGVFGTKGASVHAQEMIRAFRALGHEVTVFATKRGDRHHDNATEHVPSDLKDLPVYVVPVAGVKGAAAREQATLRTAKRMAQLAADGAFELIYERYSLFSTSGAELKDRLRTAPQRPHTRGLGIAAPRLVVEVNAPLLEEQSAHRRLHDAETAVEATLQTFAAADVISCVSTPVAEWVRRLSAGPGAEASAFTPEAPYRAGGVPTVLVTPNGVNTERFIVPESRSAENRPLTVGFLGTLKPWHGTEFLLEAFAQLTATIASADAVLEIVGDGPQRTELQALALRLGIGGQVHFRGAAAPGQVPAALAGWDVGVAPYPLSQSSGEHYFSPLKVYEYLAAGLPVVASEIGEIPEVVEHWRTGLLVPGSDPGALAAALLLLAENPQQRQQMGAAARAEAVARHRWVSRAADVLEALDGAPRLIRPARQRREPASFSRSSGRLVQQVMS
ncbi:glycosyltransferase family 4 protein [Nesterenkonia muleiensis]|uniref:glycosyltransferase family 4 protein n=1 Tax=Nesterenkonia muleiensis TaxID=2282648 RepID=UPI000E7315E0|nr:glycosyltransferase family 4 protein [Nesterenkonia muleiensis]